MKKIKNKKSGFTIIELILYIAILTIFITGAILFAWDVIYAKEKTIQHQNVEQNARIVLSRIAYEIRRAKGINSFSSSSIELENGLNDTTITLNSGVVQITTGGVGPYNLTSNQVFITDLTFTQPGSSNRDTKNIEASVSVRQANVDVSGQFEAETSMSTAAEINNQFNQSRQFLVDLSATDLSPNNRDVENITIQNTSSTNITIDQLYVSWTGTGGGENITEVQIGGGTVEWSGSQASGSTIDLTDYILTSAAGIVNIDNISFSSSMVSGLLNLDFIFSDNSTHKTLIALNAGPGPTPTPTPTPTPPPTPTPTPPASCNDYCIANSYSAGTCRKNTGACNSNGESHQTAGDSFCTGGNNSDTCCCAP